MKKLLTVVALVALALALGAGDTLAYSFDFVGPGYTITDQDSDGFSETVMFGNAFVTLTDPINDGLFGDSNPLLEWERVEFSPFTLDPTSSAPSYDFAPTFYANGFKVYDDLMAGGSILLEADITLTSLDIQGGTGSVNASFAVNLSNIEAGGNYIAGTSAIVDAFLISPVAVNITLNMAGEDMGELIGEGEKVEGTYSGSVSSVTPVPEPGTVLLLGIGLVGLVGLRRRLKK
jgi:hypothetical protein